ncbi:MAG: hypothetical protein COW73_05725 [Nitrospirae bacterium CG18_big_fil_WC_8_21_14_2_50_70_55]|nr:thioredoxin domain-containing protein [Deltaproteobacteria bacterium]PIQ05522.1 MAG: hypothetical protein COW73_05725 [Nitrospirae bacterium CG18_big_fil_WC_8_21_14_2_50_70_55]PIU78249.1 MAG: hypothetical protein COS73_07645 [Nitrospirae bacterium CG06_land_8_20_14_3_00_70_43]PIW82777.1 MAG: hypothetical protein COZ96_06875 [Nitrospirae bacterium CG_4_8_14_3_um_filter_70_85]PIX82299.1 MAG: hypothetical protein COZ33_11345 [Nitrospirae bacterium CG_4_10_14_3_um_filter_70_108]PJB95320.1 MAG: 
MAQRLTTPFRRTRRATAARVALHPTPIAVRERGRSARRATAALLALVALLAAARAPAAGLPAEVQSQATDLSPAKQEQLRQFLDGLTCPCSCGKGTLANCIATDKSCAISRRFARQAIAELRTGEQIVQARQGVAGYKKPQPNQGSGPRLDPNKQYEVQVGDAPTIGPAKAPVTVITYLDYQCPFCRRAWPTLEKLRADFPDKVRLAVKQHALPFHQQARVAARAVLAANEQGRFWDFQSRIFGANQRIDRASLIALAGELKLDVPRFTEAIDSTRFDAQIDAEAAEAVSIGATGTPTTFINGKPLVGAQPYPTFEYQVRLALGEHPTPPPAPTPPAPRGPQVDPNQRYDLHVGEAPVQGPATAPVTVVTYQDAECPYCRKVWPTLKQLREKFPEQVRIAIKQHPLPFHKHGRIASRAELAAQEQGKYWEYKDRLMADGQGLERDNLIALAKEVGLDVDKFTAALDSDRLDKRIDAEGQEAIAIGASGTPATFVNGRYLRGAQPYVNFENAVKAALEKK